MVFDGSIADFSQAISLDESLSTSCKHIPKRRSHCQNTDSFTSVLPRRQVAGVAVSKVRSSLVNRVIYSLWYFFFFKSNSVSKISFPRRAEMILALMFSKLWNCYGHRKTSIILVQSLPGKHHFYEGADFILCHCAGNLGWSSSIYMSTTRQNLTGEERHEPKWSSLPAELPSVPSFSPTSSLT